MQYEGQLKSQETIDTWNSLAEQHNLLPIRFLTPKRSKSLKVAKKRSEKTGTDFWVNVTLALQNRGQWAKDQQFPSFDQILREDILVKMLEGFYNRNSTDGKLDSLKAKMAARRKELRSNSDMDFVDIQQTLRDEGLLPSEIH